MRAPRIWCKIPFEIKINRDSRKALGVESRVEVAVNDGEFRRVARECGIYGTHIRKYPEF